MAPKGIEFVASMFLAIAIVSNVGMAQQGCMSQLISMSSCLNYVSGSASTPPASCCTALASVVKTQPRCLCTIVNGDGSSLGVTINQTLALGLPSACNVETPPSSRCTVVNGPAMSPVGSPEGAPPESESGDGGPASSTTPSVTGSKTTPSSNGATSKGVSTTNINLAANMIIIFITASFASPAFNNIF